MQLPLFLTDSVLEKRIFIRHLKKTKVTRVKSTKPADLRWGKKIKT